jgi:hypothetical protein
MTDKTTPPADVAVTDLNAAQSAAALVAMSAAFKASQPAPSPWGLSAEEANAQLAAMTDAYEKVNAPRLAAADQKVLGESASPPRELGETVTWPQISVRNKLSMIETLREVGIPDAGIERFISGKPYSKEDYEAAVRWKQRVENDPVLGKELLDGSQLRSCVRRERSAQPVRSWSNCLVATICRGWNGWKPQRPSVVPRSSTVMQSRSSNARLRNGC